MTFQKPKASVWFLNLRVKQVESELKYWAAKSITFSFDPRGTNLVSMAELAGSYARRCSDLAKAIRRLLRSGQIVPATILARALIETVGMGTLYVDDIVRLIGAHDIDKLNARFNKFYAGIKGTDTQPVHVMDAIRHMESVDREYVMYLDKKYGTFTTFMKSLEERGEDLKGKSFTEALSVLTIYSNLSEVSHPNGVGTQLLYPDRENETESIARLRERFKFRSLAAIWHCHHLVAALNRTQNFPELYRAAFGLNSTRPDDH